MTPSGGPAGLIHSPLTLKSFETRKFNLCLSKKPSDGSASHYPTRLARAKLESPWGYHSPLDGTIGRSSVIRCCAVSGVERSINRSRVMAPSDGSAHAPRGAARGPWRRYKAVAAPDPNSSPPSRLVQRRITNLSRAGTLAGTSFVRRLPIRWHQLEVVAIFSLHLGFHAASGGFYRFPPVWGTGVRLIRRTSHCGVSAEDWGLTVVGLWRSRDIRAAGEGSGFCRRGGSLATNFQLNSLILE